MGNGFALDRSLPVPLGVQLRGLVEYGIACGQLAAGERLPSVRDMALQLGIAPMTVAAVYRDLADAQLIIGRPGAGTFVAAQASAWPARDGLPRIEALLDTLLAEAELHGIGRDALMAKFHARAGLARRGRRLRLLFLGMFDDASRDYAAAIQPHLADGDSIEAALIAHVKADRTAWARAMSADLVLTIANRRAEVRHLLADGPPVATISFLPSEPTRVALAGLDPLTRLALVSVFPEFLPTMRTGMRNFSAHVTDVQAALLGGPELGGVLAAADVVVFATGAGAVLDHLRPTMRAIEYRHTPDPRDIAQIVLPLAESLRQLPAPPITEEASCVFPT